MVVLYSDVRVQLSNLKLPQGVEFACQIMSCHVMSCHVTSRHVTSCPVLSCPVLSWHGMACHVMRRCHVILSPVTFRRLTLLCHV